MLGGYEAAILKGLVGQYCGVEIIFDFIVSVSRYYFVILIVFFLFNGVMYILGERGIAKIDIRSSERTQFSALVLYIICAVPILAYRTDGTVFDLEYLLFGLCVLMFVFFTRFATNRLFTGLCPLMRNGMLFLLVIGFSMLLSLNYSLAVRQLVFACVGMVVALLIPLVFKIIPKFEKLEYLYLALSLGGLLAVLLFGSDNYGATNWIKIGSFSFQPSEFIKILFVFYLASALHRPVDSKKLIIICGAGAAVVLLLVIQRDLGGALMFFMTFMIMLYCATGSLGLFALGFGGASVAAVAAYHLFSHVQTRVAVWQNPWSDISNTGYQVTQSLFAITTWGPFGSGLTKGYASSIPVVERDFMFAAICEEMGIIFALLMFGVYIMIFYRGVHIALRCRKPLYGLLAVGFTGILAFQTFVIIGGDINMIPMTGVTLPFVSYGGSSVFVCILMLGVLEWLYSKVPEKFRAKRKSGIAYE